MLLSIGQHWGKLLPRPCVNNTAFVKIVVVFIHQRLHEAGQVVIRELFTINRTTHQFLQMVGVHTT